MQEGTRDTIPLWLASAITVCVSLPFAIWLGDYCLPIWVSFIVWAEYFALGAKPAALRIIVPAFVLGSISAAIIMTGYLILQTRLGEGTVVSIGAWALSYDDVALFVASFIGFSVFVYAMRFVPVTRQGHALPFFNGISMTLGVFFTGVFLEAAPDGLTPILEPTVAAIGAILAGLLGAGLGWFNVTIMFPRPTAKAPATARQGANV
jgi:hypothetical protein